MDEKSGDDRDQLTSEWGVSEAYNYYKNTNINADTMLPLRVCSEGYRYTSNQSHLSEKEINTTTQNGVRVSIIESSTVVDEHLPIMRVKNA